MNLTSHIGWFAIGAIAGAGFVYLLNQSNSILGQVQSAATDLQNAQSNIQTNLKKLAVANALSPGF